jgi:hypothetical protein
MPDTVLVGTKCADGNSVELSQVRTFSGLVAGIILLVFAMQTRVL